MIYDFRLKNLVKCAKEKSIFYSDIYKNIQDESFNITDIPILDPATFWKSISKESTSISDLRPIDGIIFKIQDGFGQSYYSAYSKNEWSLMTQVFARGLAAGALKRGDRVANLFHSARSPGDFLLLSESIHRSALEILHVPLTATSQTNEIIDNLKQFKINILAGPLRTLQRVAEDYLRIKNSGKRLELEIDQLLFGSEIVEPKVINHLRILFPKAEIRSIGYVAPKIGLIGYTDSSCSTREYRVFSEATWVELIDPETAQPISEEGVPGQLLTTQLFRSWMPIIRYPTGDWAQWTEPAHVHDRKFKRLNKNDLFIRRTEGLVSENKLRKRCPSQERFQSDLRCRREAEQSAER
jgi:phenylacetate-CoA ligase